MDKGSGQITNQSTVFDCNMLSLKTKCFFENAKNKFTISDLPLIFPDEKHHP